MLPDEPLSASRTCDVAGANVMPALDGWMPDAESVWFWPSRIKQVGHRPRSTASFKAAPHPGH